MLWFMNRFLLYSFAGMVLCLYYIYETVHISWIGVQCLTVLKHSETKQSWVKCISHSLHYLVFLSQKEISMQIMCMNK